MIAAFAGEVTGWLVAILAFTTIWIPYAVRGRRVAVEGWGGVGYLRRLTPHYWIGYSIAGLSLLHAGFAMSRPMQDGPGYLAGLWIATGGLFLSFGQVMLGLRLRDLRGQGRLRLRPWHFAAMVGLLSTGALHLYLNGAVVHSLLAGVGL